MQTKQTAQGNRVLSNSESACCMHTVNCTGGTGMGMRHAMTLCVHLTPNCTAAVETCPATWLGCQLIDERNLSV